MRRILRPPDVRLGALLLACIAIYPTAYLLLPRTADGASVTVVQCAAVQLVGTEFDCQGTTVFRRALTDEATVSAVHATLDGIHDWSPWPTTYNLCNAGSLCDPTQVYSFDLLWHGRVVRSYLASVHGGFHNGWVSTLGLQLWATEGPTTWQDLVRLTGIPVFPTAVR